MTRLTSITVTDFRSIRGSITVPLDAPVVLVHGPNGSGKTSLLSAIELGLTGAIPSFGRVDEHYVQHLVHKDVEESRISLRASGLPQERLDAQLRITREGVTGAPLLDDRSARFYSERCSLAQSALGRLLEIYEDKDARRSDSRLTQFVKDLLGLDHLDALIDGLHDAGDVRRLRSTVPAYWEIREDIPVLSNNLERVRSELSSTRDKEKHLAAAVDLVLPTLAIDPTQTSNTEALLEHLQGPSEEDELQRAANLRRNITAVDTQWQVLRRDKAGNARALAEQRASATSSALNAWRGGPGHAFEEAINATAALFATQTLPAGRGPVAVYEAAVELIHGDLEQLTTLLQRAADEEAKVAALSHSIERAQARVTVLDKQIAGQAENAGQLAKLLSDVLSHVHSDDCPVCGRSFSEISDTSLHAHVARRVNDLTERAGHLQALSRERRETAAAMADAQRQRDVHSARHLDPASRDEAKTRAARLTELKQSLTALEATVIAGQRLTDEATTASRELSAVQSRDLQGGALLQTLKDLATSISVDPPTETEGSGQVIARLRQYVSKRESELEARLKARRVVIGQVQELKVARHQVASLEAEVRKLEERISGLARMKDDADRLVNDARELARRARETRIEIVRRVFNDSLNSIWRDLFVRLAPEEPFVPAFALPDVAAGAVEAVLETHYRSGGKGGNPRAVLSAGNLNTAALTLFLALHLSVAPMLPWLVIDDPVQSMDEVHIAQFAALLRTLSKVHGRQIIIAVHEKQLFDYLALELSPAFEFDRLTTIQLGRNADGATLIDYQPIVWHPDPAIAA